MGDRLGTPDVVGFLLQLQAFILFFIYLQIIVRLGEGSTFPGQERWCCILGTQCDSSIMVHRGHDWPLLASGRVVGGCMESVYILQLWILMPTANASQFPYQHNSSTVIQTINILCFLIYPWWESKYFSKSEVCWVNKACWYPIEGSGICLWGLKPDFKNIPIAYEAIQLAIVNATLLTTATSSQLKGCVGTITESVIIDLYRPPRRCYKPPFPA